MTDYTKPVEIFVQDTGKIIPCKIVYQNENYNVVEYMEGSLLNFIVNADMPSCIHSDEFDHYFLRNVKPKLTSEIWVNLYKKGNTGVENSSKTAADAWVDKGRYAYFVTKHFSDGTTTNEIIPISE